LKFTEAWASLAAQNQILKWISAFLGILSILLALTTFKLSFKKELVFERACSSTFVATASGDRTVAEVTAFIKEAIGFRFNSNINPIDGYLSHNELLLRSSEQKELEARSMAQMVLVRSIEADGDSYVVDGDRVISAGEIRSAFRFPLKVNVESKARSKDNPYGLVISSIHQVDRGKK